MLPPDGAVRVSAPTTADAEEVRRFVASKADWITRAQGQVRARAPQALLDGGCARLWGEWYPVNVTYAARLSGELGEDSIQLTAPDGDAYRVP